MADDAQSEELKEQVKRLEARLETLCVEFARLAKAHAGLDRQLKAHLHVIHRDLDNVFDRVENLELKAFPNLADDIIRLDDIIGDSDDRADDPRDWRNSPSRD
jgi:predicted nuclease with TOPRIM domain